MLACFGPPSRGIFEAGSIGSIAFPECLLGQDAGLPRHREVWPANPVATTVADIRTDSGGILSSASSKGFGSPSASRPGRRRKSRWHGSPGSNRIDRPREAIPILVAEVPADLHPPRVSCPRRTSTSVACRPYR
jgi:hypothetical protein